MIVCGESKAVKTDAKSDAIQYFEEQIMTAPRPSHSAWSDFNWNLRVMLYQMCSDFQWNILKPGTVVDKNRDH